jgi:glycosyltransferase involved in cell wall biosynthesis
MKENISLVIPVKGCLQELDQLLESVCSWIALPKEILIIESTNQPQILNQKFQDFCKEQSISIVHICKSNLFPGHARNIGISNALYENIAFLDVLTIPSKDWLMSSFQLLSDKKFDGVWGLTTYMASCPKEEIIRASTYGVKPIRTFPGSIFKKDIFKKLGLFVESVRAGEDGDMFSRIALHQLKMQDSCSTIKYTGLYKISYLDVMKKWYRNYLCSAQLPYFRAHKDLYFYVLSAFLIVTAFNWNQIFSYDPSIGGWNTDSIFYLPNVTKISLFLIAFAYTFLRGIFIPLKKGVQYSFLFPLNFIKIVIFSACLDIAKTLAFLKARFFIN